MTYLCVQDMIVGICLCSQSMKCVCSRNVCCDLVVGVEAITWEQVDCVPYLWGKDVRVQ